MTTQRFACFAAGFVVLSLAGAYPGAVAPQPSAPSQPASPSASSASAEHALVGRYCLGCHNDRTRAQGLSLSSTDLRNVDADAEVWEKVVRKLRARAMPPSGSPRPDEAGYQQLIAHLETSLDRAASARPNPGRTEPFRRLNRTEYRNAVRDLLGLDVDVNDLLPADDASFGFDNVSVTGLSPTLMERYLAAAQKVSRLAVGSPVHAPLNRTIVVPPDLTQEARLDGLPFGTRGGTAAIHTFPVDGEYAFRVRLVRDRNENVEGLTRAARDRAHARRRAPGALDGHAEPQPIRAVLLRRRRRQASGVPCAGHRRPAHGVCDVPREDLGAGGDRTAAVPGELQRRPHTRGHSRPSGPSRSKVRSTRPASATRRAGGASSRARPRPVSRKTRARRRSSRPWRVARIGDRSPTTDLDAPLKFFRDARASGDDAGNGFETGIEMALRALLTSPEFLFRIERDPAGLAPGTPYQVSDVELASRLSFFLWSSAPDDELLTLAERGELRRAGVLERQVRRMLADPRAEALVTNFAGPVAVPAQPRGAPAGLAPVSRVRRQPAPGLPPRNRTAVCQRGERRSAGPGAADGRLHVPERAAGAALRHPRRLRRPVPAGQPWRRQPARRAARARQHPDRHVVREPDVAGAARQVGARQPAGHAAAAAAAERARPAGHGPTGKSLSMRERMAEHRANPACATCHQAMDPAGLSMENFDAIGRWRARGEGGTPLDVSGGLPGGPPFEGVAGLRRALAAHPDVFVVDAHGEAADLRAGARRRLPRCAGRARDRAAGRRSTTIASRRSCWASSAASRSR